MPKADHNKDTHMADTQDKNVKVLALHEIDAPYDWNSRSKDSILVEDTDPANNEGEDGGTDGIMASIEARGQDTPVHVRVHPDAKRRTKTPYQLIAGFKRYEALTRLAKKALHNKTEHPIEVDPTWSASKPTIRATIDDVTETGAFAVNMRENMARGNLTAADTCLALRRYMLARTKELGKEPTDTDVAKEMGCGQGYVSKLHRIYVGAAKCAGGRGEEILSHWRLQRSPVSVKNMDILVKLDPDRMWEGFQELVDAAKGKTAGKDPNATPDPNAWLKGVQEKAEVIGRHFGVVQYLEQISGGESIDWGTCAKSLVKGIKKDAGPEQLKEITKSFKVGFIAGLREVPDEAAAAAKEKADKTAAAMAKKDAASDKKDAKAADAKAGTNNQPAATA